MNEATWYLSLARPSWAPPSWLFGPVWTVLYVIIAISFGAVAYKAYRGELPFYVFVPFIINLICNVAFTPLQFGLKSNVLASIDVILVLATLMWALAAILPYMPWVAYVNLPYLLWVCFAAMLQLTITYLNAGRV